MWITEGLVRAGVLDHSHMFPKDVVRELPTELSPTELSLQLVKLVEQSDVCCRSSKLGADPNVNVVYYDQVPVDCTTAEWLTFGVAARVGNARQFEDDPVVGSSIQMGL